MATWSSCVALIRKILLQPRARQKRDDKDWNQEKWGKDNTPHINITECACHYVRNYRYARDDDGRCESIFQPLQERH